MIASGAKQRAALLSAATSVGLTVLKLAAGLASGSLALVSEGLHNGLDVLASGLTYFAVREADKPADEEHPYGHAKVEALAALAETGLLLALAVGVAIMALRRLGSASPLEADAAAIGVVVISLGVDAYRYRALRRVAKETRSQALEADALHYSSDFVASAFVLLGLLAAWAGWPQGDAVAAIAVALFIAVAGVQLARRTVDSLLDAAPAGLAADVRRALGGVAGIEGIEFLRIRTAGAAELGELGLRVARTHSLEGVDTIIERARARLAQTWPQMELNISAKPLALDEETVIERVLMTAARRRLFVHHVNVQRLGERLAVSLDLEVAAAMPLGRAHAVATRLEQAIAEEFGGEVEVETHIEPLETHEISGLEAPPELTAAVAERLTQSLAEWPVLRDVHDVRLRKVGDGLLGVFHATADRNATVRAAHEAIDGLERTTRAAFPAITRLVGHAEPG